MFVIYEKEKQKLPIKVWLESIEQIEPGCLEQAINLSNLPFALHHIALMPDTHQGYGMPIGGVLTTENVIVPNAVGVDIGCGMIFSQTNIPAELLKNTQTKSGSLLQIIVGDILRNIPTGFAHHPKAQPLSEEFQEMVNSTKPVAAQHEELCKRIFPSCLHQVGTLGGGNHFIEVQEDEDGMIALMIHSGSRNVGKQVCDYFNKRAKALNEKWLSTVPSEMDLAFLPTDTAEGRDYIRFMNFSLAMAKENRQQMMTKVQEILARYTEKFTGFTNIEFSMEVNAHHNYAAMEHHFGKNVWVHRKGAIRVREGDYGIIPGAMGSFSYIVKGKGNPDSFMTCSHGAGRKMGRKEAARQISVEQTMVDLKQQGVVLGKNKKSDVAEESRFAYKDIDFVIHNELDLIEPVKKLKTVGVVKG
ncbi:RtcB family protein [Heliobacterium undosum]|uniref:3'-phosphate/5'-hydroxy nucleic acid ligase n=1 Tax=Heliomicrobium undosum TaxID=121734 RepID=A0A845L7R4_9FIRM|nr:RtcB family protein [Heliomicrobium undosum]MZP29768.1 RtcB family protein [Heliomicrobium undosum]